MTTHATPAGTAGRDATTHSADTLTVRHSRIPEAEGTAYCRWVCRVISEVTTVADEYDVHLVFTEEHSGRQYTTPIVRVQLGRPEPYRFDLPEMRGVDGTAHVMAKLEITPTDKLIFSTISADIDPVWLLGVRNIALSDIVPTQHDR